MCIHTWTFGPDPCVRNKGHGHLFGHSCRCCRSCSYSCWCSTYVYSSRSRARHNNIHRQRTHRFLAQDRGLRSHCHSNNTTTQQRQQRQRGWPERSVMADAWPATLLAITSSPFSAASPVTPLLCCHCHHRRNMVIWVGPPEGEEGSLRLLDSCVANNDTPQSAARLPHLLH